MVCAIRKCPVSQQAYGIWYFLSFYVMLLIIYIFCYWRILIVIRRLTSVMTGHSTAGPSTAQTQSNQIQTNVVKTMIFVSAFYAVTDPPMNVYYFILNVHANLTIYSRAVTTHHCLSPFFYFCANSLYTTMFDPVKRILPRLIPCKKNSVQPIESVEVRMLWLQPVHLRNATDKSHKGIIKRTIIDLESLKSGIHCLTICAIQLLDRPV